MPSGKTSKAWLNFIIQGTGSRKAIRSVCKNEIAHSGGTMNLLAHLQKWHLDVCNKISPDLSQSNLDRYVTNNTKVSKLLSQHERSKTLTSAVCEFVVRDSQATQCCG